MKHKLLLLALSLFMISCSDDEGSTNNTSSGDYLPLESGKYWVYETESPSQNGRDSLYTDSAQPLGSSYTTFRTGMPATGFYSGSMADNMVRKSEDKLLITGTTSLNFSADLPFSIELEDFIMFKENANNNQVVGSLEGILQQQIEGFNVDFDYGMTTKAKESLETYTVDGRTYTDVKVMELTLNLKISSNVQGFDVTIMPAQNVMVSRQYYAKEIGVVHVVTDINYNLSDLSSFGIELPIPQSGSEHQEEVLVRYNEN